jgi:hypothetical protein
MVGPKHNKVASNETHSHVSNKTMATKNAGPFNAHAEPKLPWPIEMLPLRSLRPAERNVRTHSQKQIRQIAAHCG